MNKPVRFVMTSEDVLHDFFVPDMRVKHDIVPGPLYRSLVHARLCSARIVITCAEYCGKGHSDMHAKLVVDNDADFDKFMETGGTEWEDYKTKPAEWGKIQYERKGCSTCHSIDGSPTKGGGPSWKGIWGKMETLNDGKQVLVDERLRSRVDDVSAGENRAKASIRSCPLSRACCGKPRFKVSRRSSSR